MKFSTKAEYGLKAMVNLAKNPHKTSSIATIAKEETISVKYLERILNVLRKNNLVKSFKGVKGGYAIIQPLDKITVADIIIALDGPIAPMRCIGKTCKMEQICESKMVWEILSVQIGKTLKNIKLSELIHPIKYATSVPAKQKFNRVK